MKSKKIILGVLCLLMVFVLTGCGKTAISTSDFKSKADNNGYTTKDVTSQFQSTGIVKEATLAMSNEGYQVEFYVLSSKDNATSMFNTNKTTFETYKSGATSEGSTNLGDTQTYSLTTSSKYMYLCKVDTTLLFVNVDVKYKDKVKSFVKDLGY